MLTWGLFQNWLIIESTDKKIKMQEKSLLYVNHLPTYITYLGNYYKYSGICHISIIAFADHHQRKTGYQTFNLKWTSYFKIRDSQLNFHLGEEVNRIWLKVWAIELRECKSQYFSLNFADIDQEYRDFGNPVCLLQSYSHSQNLRNFIWKFSNL